MIFGFIGPHYWCICDGIDSLNVVSLWILSFLTTSFSQHSALMCPDLPQFSHLGQELPIWNTTFGSFPVEVRPCLQLHLLIRCKMTTFGSKTPPRVPTMGSHEGFGMDKVITPENWASEMCTHKLPHASLNFCSLGM